MTAVRKWSISPCELWQGAVGTHGYGVRNVKGEDGHWRTQLAHRLAWSAVHGPIPDDGKILHHCDTPRCVNVEHLYLGTMAQNTRDAFERGRLRRDDAGRLCSGAR